MTQESGRGNRHFPSWISGFESYLINAPTPEIWRKWAAISVVSGVLERKVWVRTLGTNLYPNLYIILVGPPGLGKSFVLEPASLLTRAMPDFHAAPSSVSKASLIDSVHDAKRKIIRPGENPAFVEFHSLHAVISELGVFLPSYDHEFMNTLQMLYDNIGKYEERKRGKDLRITIDNPQLGLLAATTPSYLNALLPPGAFDQGFISRSLMIFSGVIMASDLFAERKAAAGDWSDLIKDLKEISKLYGQFRWEPQAATAMQAWHSRGGPPTPGHPKLIHYNTRRTAHLLKLCMVISASKNNSMVIAVEDYQEALNLLTEAEVYMPEIFANMSSGGDAAIIEEAYHYICIMVEKENKPLLEHRMVQFLQQRVASHSVLRILDVMIKSNLIKLSTYVGDPPRAAYMPLPKSL